MSEGHTERLEAGLDGKYRTNREQISTQIVGRRATILAPRRPLEARWRPDPGFSTFPAS